MKTKDEIILDGKITDVASKFKSNINIIHNEHTFNAKKLFELIMIPNVDISEKLFKEENIDKFLKEKEKLVKEVCKKGFEIKIVIDGEDETQAIKAIESIIEEERNEVEKSK